jgi:hypothetical protein
MPEERTPPNAGPPKPTRPEIETAVSPIIEVILTKLFVPGAQIAALSRTEVEAALRDATARAYRMGLESKS